MAGSRSARSERVDGRMHRGAKVSAGAGPNTTGMESRSSRGARSLRKMPSPKARGGKFFTTMSSTVMRSNSWLQTSRSLPLKIV